MRGGQIGGRKVKYCRENPQNALLTTDGFTIRSRAKEDKERREREREREKERERRERKDR